MGRSRSVVGVGGENGRHGRSMKMVDGNEVGCLMGEWLSWWFLSVRFLIFGILYLFIGFWCQLRPLYDFFFIFFFNFGIV